MSAQRVIYGFHSVQSRLRQGAAGVDALYVDASRDDRRTQALVETAKGMGRMVHPVDAKRLEGLTGNARHRGVVAIVAPPAARELDDILDALAEPPLLLILDGVTDPHNLGACLRVADAMGVHAVIAPKDRAVGITPVVSKVASGAAESVPYFAVTISPARCASSRIATSGSSAPTSVPRPTSTARSSPARSGWSWGPRGRSCAGSPASHDT